MREHHDEPRPGESTDLFGDDLLPFAEEDDDLAGELLEGPHVVPPPTPAKKFRKGLGKVFMLVGGVIALFVVLYAADLISSAGDVPRGVTVAGIDVGGLTHRDAADKLHRELEPRLTKPFSVRGGDVRTQLVPAESGLGLDWPNTLEQAGHQPLSPITRILSFFTQREVGVVTKSDPKIVSQSVRDLAEATLDHPVVEGGVGFTPILGSDGGVTPYPIEPRQGQRLDDVDGAVKAITDGWLNPHGIDVRMNIIPVKASSAGVHTVLDKIVAPAVAKPVVVHGQGRDAVLKPAAIASSFQFAGKDGGAVEVRIDQGKLRDAVLPELKPTETDGKDAEIVFEADRPTVKPSEDARKINWEKTFVPLTQVLAKPDGRDLRVTYDAKKPSLTTDAANAFGIKDVIGEFTVGGMSGPIATNNQILAARVSGAVVKPGETFSLGARSGSRTAENGYVAAPVNEDGTGPNVVGGGVSQFASVLYNAAYLAGLADGGHVPHDYYLDRYPAARDAKAVNTDGSPVELKITNDAPTGIAIQATASGDSVTVRIWGTKRFRVESAASGRSDLSPPPIQIGPGTGGGACQPSSGSPGFTVSDTRVLYDVNSGAEVRRENRTATYAGRPIVLC
ncbi:VanW family protein [Amycolatopsis sp. NPDC059027]|uniref:VanW family protein n=1 Tax=unclassified Amycolatopsis TaxID=2618356 RepID=UPI00366CB83D